MTQLKSSFLSITYNFFGQVARTMILNSTVNLTASLKNCQTLLLFELYLVDVVAANWKYIKSWKIEEQIQFSSL